MENLPNRSAAFPAANSSGNDSAVNAIIPPSDCTAFCFLFYTVLIGLITIFGTMGNVLSIAVLQKDRHNRVAVFLLQSLALVDTFVLLISALVLSIIYGLLPYINQSQTTHIVIPYIVKYVHPFGYMAQCGTIWITVLLAVNRYIAIVAPFHAQKLCTLNKARLQVLVIIVAITVLNIPRFFQYDIKHKQDNQTGEYYIVLNETGIGERSLFGVIYTNIIYTFLVLVAPLIVLIAINSRIIIELKRLKRRQSIISNDTEKASSRSEEDNITFIMVIIIVILICCHTPDRIFLMYRYFFHVSVRCGEIQYYVYNMCNLLIIVNSSSNFIVYYVMRRRFRRTLIMKLCAWRGLDEYKETASFLEPCKSQSYPKEEDKMDVITVIENKCADSGICLKETYTRSASSPMIN